MSRLSLAMMLFDTTINPVGHLGTFLIMEVSLFQRFINAHLYCIGTDTTCPDYRGVLILECPQEEV